MIPGLEILNLHAQGGMAEVYRARGKGADGRTWLYAVKRILPELTGDPLLRRMFAEEARIASMLVHPNVVRVYDLVRGENDDYYIVMEFLQGRDVAEAIDVANRDGRSLPIWLCIHAAREVCKALVYATPQALDREGKKLALIHRDISPHNIFVCIDGQVKLTDFGVAKVAQSNVVTQAGVTKGKFGYMSPEQLLSEKLDFRSDLFNVGILLYETLTGQRLFFGENVSLFLQAMLRAEVPALDPKLGVPTELEQLIRRALSKDREQRPATPQAFDDELGAIAARYGLLANREQVAMELRAIFGGELDSPPVPQTPSEAAGMKLTSVQVAAPAVVRRVPSRVLLQPLDEPDPDTEAFKSNSLPTYADKRSLAVASTDRPPEPIVDRKVVRHRTKTRPQGFALVPEPAVLAARSKARSVRPLSEPSGDPETLLPDDPRLAEPEPVPDRSRRKPTVIVVGGAGAKPLAARPQSNRASGSGNAEDRLDDGRSVVTRSSRVVPLPSSKKE
jgi:serine/threonine-protein kinase